MAKQTVEICDTRFYVAPSGASVNIGTALDICLISFGAHHKKLATSPHC
jgi:hypothetical protein